jgi:hypothetical protein
VVYVSDRHRDFTKRTAIAYVSDILLSEYGDWFLSGGSKWTLDLAKLREAFPGCQDLEWLSGKVTVEPEYKHKDETTKQPKITLTVMPEHVSHELYKQKPDVSPEMLMPSLKKFKQEYRNPMRAGFIIMQFSDSKAHQDILSAIRSTLNRFGIAGLRADEKEYSDELFPNIRTYMHGCGFGIAVFERILKDDFNPNISLEVGYMSALGKPVCFLKDRTLEALHTDIVGKLYRDFDPQDAAGTIPIQLEAWLRDKAII